MVFASLCARAGNTGADFVKPVALLKYGVPAAAVFGFIAGTALAYPGAELAGHAKVSMIHAIAIAQKARPGTITDKELERERGGSGLRYSFDIKSGAKTYEVGVDAMT